jgi:lipoprotein-anchoring transpeptidase ErfK/SrfK
VNAYLVCNTKMAIAEDSKMVRVGGHGASVGTGRLWRIALLTLAGAIGTASEADAALYYWSGYDSGYYYLPPPTVPQRRPRVRRHQTRKIEAPEKESAKPQGPLILAISIERQSLKIYDANGFFAETPISTGMRGHPTPMGVFSVIQKHKFHHSNIYSGAPMPYMQRITWSGVAMHAGVLPGYPASHGCIRMPMAFAVKMWNWTKMGARVVVTPGEITPASFSHPLLAARRVVPKPVAANEPQADAPPAAKTDMAADADATPKPVTSEASLELRSTVGHDDGVKPVIAERAAATPLRVQTHTVYASGDMPAAKASVTMSDAAPSGGNAPPRDAAAAASGSAPSITTDPISVKSGEASNTEVKSEAAKSETAKLEAQPMTTRPRPNRPKRRPPKSSLPRPTRPTKNSTRSRLPRMPAAMLQSLRHQQTRTLRPKKRPSRRGSKPGQMMSKHRRRKLTRPNPAKSGTRASWR